MKWWFKKHGRDFNPTMMEVFYGISIIPAILSTLS
jgi:hypothetical protein